jgi:serine protease inhibitor
MARGPLCAGLLAVALILASCGRSAPPPGDAGRIDTELVAHLSDEDAGTVGDAVNAFGFDLLREVSDGNDNAITSPLSVGVLLAMVLAGAGGDTAQAMAELLLVDDSRDVRVGALLGRLADTDDVTLSVANALWANAGTPFEDDYVSFVRSTFGATLEEADLGAQETADAIDAWVGENTEGLIEGIAQELALPDPLAVLVLLNAVYFLGEWTKQFDPAMTREESFTLADGSKAEVPRMNMHQEMFGYVEGDGFRMLRLPYGEEGRYGMEVLLPDEDTSLAEMLGSLDATGWRSAVRGLVEREVAHLALPRFELEWSGMLNEPLERLGMGVAFGPEADFRPMSPTAPSLDRVVHKTYIRVDEKGTEAAAVTGGSMALSGGPDVIVFRVDRPFAFTISDAETGTILFLGAVTDPRG